MKKKCSDLQRSFTQEMESINKKIRDMRQESSLEAKKMRGEWSEKNQILEVRISELSSDPLMKKNGRSADSSPGFAKKTHVLDLKHTAGMAVMENVKKNVTTEIAAKKNVRI